MRDCAPGSLYNAGEMQDADDRLRGYRASSARHDHADRRRPELPRPARRGDRERRPRRSTIGAGINSNGGVGGQHHATSSGTSTSPTSPPASASCSPTGRSPAPARTSASCSSPAPSRATPASRSPSRGCSTSRTASRGELYLRDPRPRGLRRPAARRTRSRSASGSTTSGRPASPLRGEDVEIHDIEDDRSARPGDPGGRGAQHADQRRRRRPVRHDRPRLLPLPRARSSTGRVECVRRARRRLQLPASSRSGSTATTRSSEDLPDRKTVLGVPRQRRVHHRRLVVLRAVLRRRHRQRPRVPVPRHQPRGRAWTKTRSAATSA